MLQRRDFLAGALLALPSFQLARAAERGCVPTEGVELGPFYRPNAPRRVSLSDPSDPGEPLAVEGRVLAADRCQPLEGAIVEVWQANAAGDYDITERGQDDTPYRFRALLQSGSGGAYAFDTIVPGQYGRRAKHIHYFVHAKGYEPLVTQLYFAGDNRNETDRLVRRSLIVEPAPATVRGRSGARTRFELVMRTRKPNHPKSVLLFPELEGEYRSNQKMFPLLERDREEAASFRLVRSGDRLDARVRGLPDAEVIFDAPQEFRVVEFGVKGRVKLDRSGRMALEYTDVDGRHHHAEKL
jgi:catechol 1,2-dioxygenase